MLEITLVLPGAKDSSKVMTGPWAMPLNPPKLERLLSTVSLYLRPI
ncbi:hypothetical protein FB548_3769 [Pseudoxanthomonas sp. 3HH-4]|nr:hypothetical protein FB548_3769 [Pseudoxanthomonas sp. 3HH-4]